MKPGQERIICVSWSIFLGLIFLKHVHHLPGGGCEALKLALMKGGGGP